VCGASRPHLLVLPVLALAAHRSSAHAALGTSVLVSVTLFALLPALFVYAAYRCGRVRDLDLSDRRDRLAPALFGLACAAVGRLALGIGEAPVPFLWLASGLLLQLAALAATTWRFKISYHGAGAADLVTAAAVFSGPPLAVGCLLWALAVGWARCHLGRHRVREVLAGFGSAALLLVAPW
jgi:hypothetical protein